MVTSSHELDERPSEAPRVERAESNTQLLKSCDTDVQKSNQIFRRAWLQAIDDNQLTLFGFRRFRTAHLISLRLLEAEIDQIDHQMFQAGLSLGIQPGEANRLGLRQARKDPNVKVGGDIPNSLVTKLRELLKQYGVHIQRMNNH